MITKIKVVALDLEGTLISTAMSVFPRPGLFSFLEFCHRTFERVVLFTAVDDERVAEIAEILVDEGLAPPWFRDIECVQWEGRTKDLRCVEGVMPDEVLLVDDMEWYVHDAQKEYWIPVAPFSDPYPDDDRELESVEQRLLGRIQSG